MNPIIYVFNDRKKWSESQNLYYKSINKFKRRRKYFESNFDVEELSIIIYRETSYVLNYLIVFELIHKWMKKLF